MAWSIPRAGDKVIQLLKRHGISIDPATHEQLRSECHARLFGYSCMVANVMSLSTFRVRVNTEWFRPGSSDKSKPRSRNIRLSEAFDFQLVPTSGILYAIYYLALRDFTLKLELDKDKWFNKPWWGIRVNEDEGTFVWEGGNTISFPLTPLCTPQALYIREKQYLINSNKDQEST